MAALSRQCFEQCGCTRGYDQGPNPYCEQRPGMCGCLCHEPPGGRR